MNSMGCFVANPQVSSAPRGATCLAVILVAACSGDGGGAANPLQAPGGVEKSFIIVDEIYGYHGAGVNLSHEGYRGTYQQVNDATRVTVNGQPADLPDLKEGEVALIRGVRVDYSDGRPPSQRFDSIDVRHLLVGPIDSIDPSRARLVVMGQTVLVSGDTVVENAYVSDGGLADLQPGEAVAVSGFLGATHEVIATRIARHGSTGEVRLQGLIAEADPATHRFRVGTVDVDYGQAAIDLQDFPVGAPGVGDQVVLLADSAPVAGPLVPRTVLYVPRNLDVDPNTWVVLNGVVTRYASTSDFDVGGVAVALGCSGPDCGSDPQHLRANAMVQVRGTPGDSGTFEASNLALFDRGATRLVTTRLVAPITAIDSSTDAFTVYGFQVQSSAVTLFADERGADAVEISPADLQVGDVVAAQGTYGGVPGLLLATSIAHVPDQDPQLVIRRSQRAEPAIGVLGRSIMTNTATLVDECGKPANLALLFDSQLYVYYLTVGLPFVMTDPMEAVWVSIFDDYC